MRKKVFMVAVLVALCCSTIGCSKGNKKALADVENGVDNLKSDIEEGMNNNGDEKYLKDNTNEDKKVNEDKKNEAGKDNKDEAKKNNKLKADTTDTGKYDTAYVVSAKGDYSGIDNVKGKYTSINKAIDEAKAGTVIYVKSGTYYENIDFKKSGTEEKPIKILGVEKSGKKPIIDGSKIDKNAAPAIIKIKDQSNIKIDNMEMCNYELEGNKVPEAVSIRGTSSNIYVQNCDVHDIKINYDQKGNAHGISVAGDNSSKAINNVNILNNNVHNLKLGYSESVVVNGNSTNVKVNYNEIHDNDNIGIDFAGHYGVCADSSKDRVRNCECIGNHVYNISSKTNKAYKGSLAADGIYVDGGKDVIIKDNVVNNCDIGIEAASENQGKLTENVTIENNLVYNCKGFAGICFGGSSESNGRATGINVKNNTAYNNSVNLVIQQANSDTNVVKNNIFARNDNKSNLEITSSVANNNKNIIKDNVFTNNGELVSSVKNNNVIANVTFKDASKGDFTVTDAKYKQYGYQGTKN